MNAVRAIWMLTFALFAGVGVGIVWWPAAQTVAELRSAAANYYDEASRNEAEVRQARRLRALQGRVAADLKTLAPAGGRAAASAGMLRLLSLEQKAYGVNVKSIVPGTVQSSVRGKTAGAGPFEETSVEIALSGRFADVLRFVADIPRHATLLDVRDVSVSDSGTPSDSPQLAVTLHATLYRFRGNIPKEDVHASSAL